MGSRIFADELHGGTDYVVVNLTAAEYEVEEPRADDL